jgi:hypothetical protein
VQPQSNDLGVINMQHDGAPFAPRTAQTSDVLLAQWLGRQHQAGEAHDAANATEMQPPLHQAGKVSLHQQFSRYGKEAREHDKAALMDHAQHVAKGRGG